MNTFSAKLCGIALSDGNLDGIVATFPDSCGAESLRTASCHTQEYLYLKGCELYQNGGS